MPAIDLARLKTQAALLTEHFNQPEAFIRALLEMLDFYTNRTIRSSQAAKRTALPSYHTPRPVLRQIEIELESLADSLPLESTAIANALWNAGYIETRLLAAYLIGAMPPSKAMSLLTRLPVWLQQAQDKEIHQSLLTDALARLRQENPDAFISLLEDWLKSPDHRLQSWGLQALIPLLTTPRYENLPAIFRIILPAVESATPSTQLDLQACFRALEDISLTETLHFLREIITKNSNPQFARLLRRMSPAFSPELQAGLRETLREQT